MLNLAFVVCNTDKHVDDFYNIYRRCKQCNIKRVLERYYNNKDDKLEKRGNKHARFIDLENRMKTLEETLTKNDSELKIKYLWTNFIPNRPKRIIPQKKLMFIIVITFGL